MEFRDWLRGELDRRYWNQSDLAKKSGLSQAAISRLLSTIPGIKRRPGIDACQAIAHAFELPVAIVYQAAGYQPTGELINKRRMMIEFMAEQMDEQEYSDLLDYIQFRVSKSKKGR